ncbi:MAG: hypothetical protein RPR40_02540, partial [Bermanella sp.]
MYDACFQAVLPGEAIALQFRPAVTSDRLGSFDSFSYGTKIEFVKKPGSARLRGFYTFFGISAKGKGAAEW